MLWTDSIFISQDDLTRIDSQVVSVAASEGITLTGDNGLIRAAVEEAGNELQKLIIAFGGYLNAGDLTANHLAAVLNVGIGNSVRQKAVLDQIGVSGYSPTSWNHIKQWAVHWTLRIFYRNAFSRNTNDRYEKKMNFYKDELIRRLTPTLYGMGVPIILQPLAAPAAYFTNNPGTWGPANVTLVSGGGTLTTGRFIDVVITYVDASAANLYVSSSQSNNAESNGSCVVTQEMATANVLEVSIASLNPPTGAQDPSQVLICVISPLQATGWNVYAGTSGGTLYLQNATPIPIDTETFTFPGDPVLTGPTLTTGQYANRRLSLVPMRQRA
jgi:hypothetical protein